jgi:DNA-binding LacI/PurR family transcriptional regulator
MKATLHRYRTVYDSLRAQWERGELTVGNRLQSDRELSQAFGVSRLTVSRALSCLVEEGVLERRAGSGTFVRRPPVEVLPTQIKPIAALFHNAHWESNQLILEGLTEALGGQPVIVMNGDSSTEREAAHLDRLLTEARAGTISGVLAVPLGTYLNTERYRRLAEVCPLVFIDRYIPGIAASRVVSDNFEAAAAATQHLLDQGHKHIGYLHSWALPNTSLRDRRLGYMSALTEAGVPYEQIAALTGIVTGVTDDELFRDCGEMIQKWLASPQPPTALLCANDRVMQAVVWLRRQTAEAGDLVLLGFCNYEQWLMLAPLPQTILKQRFTAMGAEALHLLRRAEKNGIEVLPQAIVLPFDWASVTPPS